MSRRLGARAACFALTSLACTSSVVGQLCASGFSSSFDSVGEQMRLRGFRSGDNSFGGLYGVGCAYTQVATASASACETACVDSSSACQGYEYIAVAGECTCHPINVLCWWLYTFSISSEKHADYRRPRARLIEQSRTVLHNTYRL